MAQTTESATWNSEVSVHSLLLAIAIAFEIAATTMLKLSEGFTRPWPTFLSIAGYVVSFYLLSVALLKIPVSVAYAIWSGAGTAAVAVIGVLWLGEAIDLVKIVAIMLIIIGVVLLNLHTAA